MCYFIQGSHLFAGSKALVDIFEIAHQWLQKKKNHSRVHLEICTPKFTKVTDWSKL